MKINTDSHPLPFAVLHFTFCRFAVYASALCFLPFALWSQTPCATGHLHERLFTENADYRAAHDTLEKSILHSTLNATKQSSGTEFSPVIMPLVLPVVVHVVHQNGPENLSDAQVETAIAHLNAAFAHTGYFAQQGAGSDVLVQFCLARQTPDGKATNGITRTASPLTEMILETQDLTLKNLSRWNPQQYINIWLVRGISSTAVGPSVGGYAYLPAAHGLPYDGLVLEAAGLGSTPAQVSNLAHEMGHYLGLYHTFDGGCANANCLTAGDRVCDTPPDRATGAGCPFNSCSTDANDTSPNNPFTTDVDDFGWNFMDYSPQTCYSGFTAGQGLRMHLAVEDARKSLLTSKACLEPCPVPISAAFGVSSSSIVAGASLTFSNLSVGATQFAWYDNGSLFSQNATPPPYTPSSTGIHALRLVVSNGDPRCADTTEVLVSVACNITAAIVASDTAVDVGQSVTLAALTSGATVFIWTVDGAVVSNAPAFSQIFTQNGYVSVVLVASNTFCSISATLTLAVGSVCPEYLYREYDRSAVVSNGLSKLRPRILEPTNDGGHVIGGYVLIKGASLTKISSGGAQEWQRTYPPLNTISSIVNTPDGGYLLTGFTTVSQNEGFAMKCDATGQVLWAKKWTALKSGSVLAAVCQSGGYFLAVQRVTSLLTLEWWAIRTDVDGNPLWSVGLTDPNRLVEIQGTADGGLMVARASGSLVKLASDGSLVFSKRYGVANQPGLSLFLEEKRRVMDTDGNDTYLVSGSSSWTDGYLWKIDATGEVVWARQSPNYTKMAVLPGDGVVVCKDNQFSKLAATDGAQTWAMAISATFPIFGTENYVRRLEGANTGKFIHTSREPGVWSPIRTFVATTADGTHGDCVGANSPSDQNLSVNLVAQTEPLTFSPFPPDWATLNIIAETDSNIFVVNQFCNEQRCPEICGNDRDDDGDNYVDCYDTDCACAQPPLGCIDQTLLADIKGRIAWTTPTDRVSVVGVPLVGNLNPLTDSIPEIIISTAPSSINGVGARFLIFRGDGSNVASPQQIIVPGGYLNFPMAHPTIADLDNDGRPEFIVINSEGAIHIYTDYQPGANPPMKLWALSGNNSPLGMRLYPADFDHDGISELYSGSQVFWLKSKLPNGLVEISNSSGPQNYGQLYAASQIFPVNSSLVADVLGNPSACKQCPTMEIAAGGSIFSVEKQGDGFVTNELNLGNTTLSYAAIAAVQPDGVLKSVIPGINTGIATILDGNAILFNTNLGNTPAYGCAQICITNVYDDRLKGFAQDLPEILLGFRGVLYCFNAQAPASTANAWWQTPINFRSGLPTAFLEQDGHTLAVTAFDFNGDGYDEIVLHDSTDLRVIYGGPAPFPPGVDAQRNWFKINAPSLPFDNYPVIADVDGDLEADIVYTTYASPDDQKTPDDRRGRLVVLKSDGGQWYPARPVWNQFSYLPVAIHDDLTVPRQQQPHQMPLPPGSTNRPLNKNQAQLPLLDSLYRPYRPLTDFSLRSDSSRCIAGGDSIRAWFTLCNYGEKPLPDSLPIALYASDPTATNAPLLLRIYLKGWLRKGQCRSFFVDLPATFNQPLYAVANDDGTQPRPFNLAANFPARRGVECGYADNIASFSVFYEEKPLDLGPDLARCGSSTITLHAGPGFEKYRWQNGSTDSTLTAFAAGKYWVEARDRCGKIYSDTLLITLSSIAGLLLPQDTAICVGDSARLLVGGSGLEKISWSPAAGLSCTDCRDPVAQPAATTTYTLTVQSGECFVTDTVRVEVQTIALDFVSQNPTCNTLGSITAVPGGSGPFQFKWSNGSTSPILTGLAPGAYSLTLTSALGCALVRERALVRIMPTSASAREDSVRCYGLSDGRLWVTDVTGGLPPFAYSLDGLNFQPDSVFENLPAATYTLTVRDANGCTWAGPVAVPQPPVFQVTLAGSSSVIPGLPSPLAATVAPVSAALQQIRWEPAAMFPEQNRLNQTLRIQQPTSVTVTVTDERDCPASDTLVVDVDKTRFVFFPNIIAPDGGGLFENEQFTAYGSDAVAQVRWLRVFDRWGNLLFERTNFAPNDPQLGWDGRFQGQKMPPGVYVWAAEVEFTDGERRRWEGEVGVVR